jgi:hypothetical protein
MALFAETFSDWALGGRLTLTRLGPWRALLSAAAKPRDVQDEVLRRILEVNAKTEFGSAHGFSDIKSPDDYRRAVPVQTFDTLHPYVAAQDTTDSLALTTAPPVFYQRTSGTLGTPKDGLRPARRYAPVHRQGCRYRQPGDRRSHGGRHPLRLSDRIDL